jgi:hypothetical protein
MTDPKQEILRLLMQKQMPGMLGGQPGGAPRRFSGTARLAPGAIGASTPFVTSPGSTANGSLDGFAGTDGDLAAPAWRSGAESAVTTPTAIGGRGDKQGRVGGHTATNPEAMISEALLYAQHAKGEAPLRFADNIQSQIRKLPLDPNLEHSIKRAVYDVYGPGYSVVVGSGGQPEAKSDAEALNMTLDSTWEPKDQEKDPTDTQYKGRTGSVRHDLGHAADMRVFDPDGNILTHEQLGRLAQYWQAKDLGSTGIGLPGQGIHIDDFTDRVRSWDYWPEGYVHRDKMQKWVDAGMAGIEPELYPAPGVPAPTMSASEMGIEDPSVNSRQARIYGDFNDGDPQAGAEEAYEYFKLMPRDRYGDPYKPIPKPRPSR